MRRLLDPRVCGGCDLGEAYSKHLGQACSCEVLQSNLAALIRQTLRGASARDVNPLRSRTTFSASKC